MDQSRIPRKDAEMATYLMQTMQYLKQPYLPKVSQSVGPESTVNVHTGQLPPYVVLQFENTGPMAGPSLFFCLSVDEGSTCTPAGSLTVAAGSTESRTVRELGDPVLMHINATNTDLATPAPFTLDFPLNWQRLGLMDGQMVEWESRGKAWLLKYLDAQDDSKRTPDLVTDKNLLAEEFIAFAEPVLTLIAGSPNIVTGDYSKFNIAPPNKERHPRPDIEGTPFTGMRPMSGCAVKFKNTQFEHALRARMHPDASALELRWVLLPLDAPAPLSPAECPNTHMSTRATFTLEFGVEHAGKRLHCFTRWANLHEPEKSGKWSTHQSMVLSD